MLRELQDSLSDILNLHLRKRLYGDEALQKVNEYYQEVTQSHIADQPTAP